MERINGDSAELRTLPPFCWFDDAQLSRAMPTTQRRQYAARTVIQHAGSAVDGLYLLLSGRVQIVHQDAEGREFIAATIRSHDFFGELGLLEGGNGVGTIRACEPCNVVFIPRLTVIECLRANSHAAMCMLEKVTKRLGACHQKLAELALTTVYQRVTRLLLENTAETEDEPVLAFGAEELARRAGASREMISRIVRTMIEQGIVRRHKRKLIIIDRQALGRDVCRYKKRALVEQGRSLHREALTQP